MNCGLDKFPSTPHLANLSENQIRGDKVLSEEERVDFLRRPVVVEEKIDGANLGLSFDSDGNILMQNRGSYLDDAYIGQWKKLGEWLYPRIDDLFEILTDRYILFGEWCYAQHTIYYSKLPDWFIGFDVYDKKECRFFSTLRRNDVLRELKFYPVPLLGCGHYTLDELKGLFSTSVYGDYPAEGLYLRVDERDWLVDRVKLVRPAFIQSTDKHWSQQELRVNKTANH